LENQFCVDPGASIYGQLEFDAGTPMKPVQIGTADTYDRRVHLPGLFKQLNAGKRRNEPTIISCIPYLYPIQRST